jgi:hypothetical protein
MAARLLRNHTRAAPPKSELEFHANGFGLGVQLKHVVSHLAAPSGFLVSAERQRGIENIIAIDPNRAGPQLRGEGVGLGDIIGPNTRGQPVIGIVLCRPMRRLWHTASAVESM